MRDADWSRRILLRSDWLGPPVALFTTELNKQKQKNSEFTAEGN